MSRHTFLCLDGHTCGNPVRLVAGGAPALRGATMSDRRQDFLAHHDWIRRALMFEPRGHDMMSGAFLYEPINADSDASILFIETSGCLPMCGHGTIGIVTLALENGLLTPHEEGRLRLDAPAGCIDVSFRREGDAVREVSLVNVPSYLAHQGVAVDCPSLGGLTLDIAYGGNYYAIVEPQPSYPGLGDFSAADVLRFSPLLRDAVNAAVNCVHPLDKTIYGVSHVMWTGPTITERGDARNAVFYGDKAIDRSPCGTGTSARMAQLCARGELSVGEQFVHESIIGCCFTGRVLAEEALGGYTAIRPEITGWAVQTGINTIIVDDRDPYAHGFQVV